MLKFDIIIIGGGPAGSTLARLLPKNLSVLIIGCMSEKLCGGLLSSDSQKFFAQTDIALPVNLLVDPQIFSVDTIDLSQNLQRRYQRFYLNIDRKKFDEWLWSMIPSSIYKVIGKAKNIKRTDEGYYVEYTEKAELKTAECKYLIGADGANSLVRRTFFPKFKMRKYLAIQQTFTVKENSPIYSCIFDKSLTDCCAWHISKKDNLIFGGAFPLKNSRTNFELFKKRLELFGFNSQNAGEIDACLVIRPKSTNEILLGKDNIFFIGEAAGFVSPSSLEGISRAMYSAKALADAFYGNNILKNYKKNTFYMRVNIFLKLLKCPFLYNPFLRKIVMKSGIKSLKLLKEPNAD